ncbi:MAG: carbamoyltransferase HypF [Faecalibacterium sp.]|jgi:hydrogenase maturation protein HypF|nr:carbamoyltransferase HypF [Faecalibacterium sp.]
MPEKKRIAVTVSGIVQGVGFRPFVHRCAEKYGLCGWARNTAAGVALELEGEETALGGFLQELTANPPPLAVIEAVQTAPQKTTAGYTDFTIRKSLAGVHDTMISPDVGTCPDCLRELRDPANRRYRYPFLNCTNCGPRFTITKTVPYDRSNTTMAAFPMCPDCAAEYADIQDRRYHAQPDCCPVCGPRLWFCGADGKEQPGDAIAAAVALLRRGGILAVKGLGGFHLACTLDDPETARILRRRKHRDEKPFALMCPSVAAAKTYCQVSPQEAALLESRRRPIVLLQKRTPGLLPQISENGAIGIMLPYTPLHYLLFDPLPQGGGKKQAAEMPLHSEDFGTIAAQGGAVPPEQADAFSFPALVMTSANLSDCPVITDNAEALEKLAGIADGFLLHNRAIEARCDDSLVRIFEGNPYFLRRSRGYAPQPLFLPFDTSGILALGAEQKASFALGKEHTLFYSQHIGDLKNAETLAHYETQIARFERLFGVAPRRLVCDLHPDYLSSEYAQRLAEKESLPLLPVQHHWAHMASCMADNGLDGGCIGLIWDGTGLGTDGTIWGGEALAGDYTHVARAASLRPILLPGGDRAVREIGRIGFSLARDAGISEASPLPDAEKARLDKLLNAGLNCPSSSGMGRLFDGVYALLTGRLIASYEGQGAVLLEAMAEQSGAKTGTAPFPVEFYWDNALPRWDTRVMLRALWTQKCAGVPPETLAMRFLETLVQVGVKQCCFAREASGFGRVVLSGGVFQNMLLLARLPEALKAQGFTVYHPCRVAANDEGIALGQAAIAAHTAL